MSENSSSKKTKGLLSMVFIGGAFAFASMGSVSPEEVTKKAPSVKADNPYIVMIDPADPEFFGIGQYAIGGKVPPETTVNVVLDKRSAIEVKSDKKGEYTADLKIEEAGAHTIAIAYKEKDGKEKNFKYEFKAAKFPNGQKDADIVNKEGEKQAKEPVDPPTSLLPEDDDVKYPDPKPDAAVKQPKAKPPVKSKLPVKATVKGVPFVISSHSNFNLVPKGIINIGGKGAAGDKIMLLVDGKPSVKGTIKSNGRWTFPVKVNAPGKRVFTAQNLKTKKISKVILKIK